MERPSFTLSGFSGAAGQLSGKSAVTYGSVNATTVREIPGDVTPERFSAV
jgi:hypothetical protein